MALVLKNKDGFWYWSDKNPHRYYLLGRGLRKCRCSLSSHRSDLATDSRRGRSLRHHFYMPGLQGAGHGC
jgi:hypothetical protein